MSARIERMKLRFPRAEDAMRFNKPLRDGRKRNVQVGE